MPTQITVPVADRTKSVQYGAPYSAPLTFNPDKDLTFQTSGILRGLSITVDTVPDPDEVTVASGTAIQRGITIDMTSSQLVQVPSPVTFPLYLVMENQNETSGSDVTILFTTSPAADSIIIAEWPTGPITSYTQPNKISIKDLRADIDSLAISVPAHKDTHKTGGSDAFTGADQIEAIVKRFVESGGPTGLTLGAVPDNTLWKRSGGSVIGQATGPGSGLNADLLDGLHASDIQQGIPLLSSSFYFSNTTGSASTGALGFTPRFAYVIGWGYYPSLADTYMGWGVIHTSGTFWQGSLNERVAAVGERSLNGDRVWGVSGALSYLSCVQFNPSGVVLTWQAGTTLTFWNGFLIVTGQNP